MPISRTLLARGPHIYFPITQEKPPYRIDLKIRKVMTFYAFPLIATSTAPSKRILDTFFQLRSLSVYVSL